MSRQFWFTQGSNAVRESTCTGSVTLILTLVAGGWTACVAMPLTALVFNQFFTLVSLGRPERSVPQKHGVGPCGGGVAVVAETEAQFDLVVPYGVEAPVEVFSQGCPPGSRNH